MDLKKLHNKFSSLSPTISLGVNEHLTVVFLLFIFTEPGKPMVHNSSESVFFLEKLVKIVDIPIYYWF